METGGTVSYLLMGHVRCRLVDQVNFCVVQDGSDDRKDLLFAVGYVPSRFLATAQLEQARAVTVDHV